jgi:hypothetical protein
MLIARQGAERGQVRRPGGHDHLDVHLPACAQDGDQVADAADDRHHSAHCGTTAPPL